MIVKNPTEADVHEYPIQDPSTKQVHLWSIRSGEVLNFPDYVGQYLIETYGFLQRVITAEQQKQEDEERKKIAQGKHFSQLVVLPDVKVQESTPVKVETPEKATGMTQELVESEPEPYKKVEQPSQATA